MIYRIKETCGNTLRKAITKDAHSKDGRETAKSTAIQDTDQSGFLWPRVKATYIHGSRWPDPIEMVYIVDVE